MNRRRDRTLCETVYSSAARSNADDSLTYARDLVVLGTGSARCSPLLGDPEFAGILAQSEKVPPFAPPEQRKDVRLQRNVL